MTVYKKRRSPWLLVALSLVLVGGLALFILAASPSENPKDVLGTTVTSEGPNQVTIDGVKVDNPFNFVKFWRQQGFIIGERIVEDTRQQRTQGDEQISFTTRHHKYLLVPANPTSDFAQAMEAFVARFPEEANFTWEKSKGSLSGSYQETVVGRGEFVFAEYSFSLQTPFTNNQSELIGGAEGEPPTIDSRPKLAIVIDDWGYPTRAAEPMLAYPFPITMAVLPFLPRSVELAESGSDLGHEIILHLPMEPTNPSLDPGPGAVLSDMSEEEVREQLRENLADLAMVTGVNNHMGSKGTSDPELMETTLQFLKERGLFFLDSYTTTTSVVREVASQIGIPNARNILFVDNVNDEAEITKRLRSGIRLAKERGSAIIIGHVRPHTANALWALIPEILMSGVELVPVSHLLNYPESYSQPVEQEELEEAVPAYRMYQEEEI